MFGKLIDGELLYFRPPLRTATEDIYTDDAELLLSHGWKEIVYTEPPEEREGYTPAPYWTETDTQIVQAWEYVEAQAEEQDYISALDALGVMTND